MADENTKNKKSDTEEKSSEVPGNSRVVAPSENLATAKISDHLQNLIDKLTEATKDLFYISETDAPFEAFVWEPEAGLDKFSTVSATDVLRLSENAPETRFSEQSLADFFRFPTTEQDWHTDEDKTIVKRYVILKELIENNLSDAKTYKVGAVEIEIYIIGVAADGNLAGIKTKAVET